MTLSHKKHHKHKHGKSKSFIKKNYFDFNTTPVHQPLTPSGGSSQMKSLISKSNNTPIAGSKKLGHHRHKKNASNNKIEK